MKYSAYIAKVREKALEHAENMEYDIASARESVASETITQIAFHLFHLRGSIPDGWVGEARHIAELLSVPEKFVEGLKTSSVEKILEEWEKNEQTA